MNRLRSEWYLTRLFLVSLTGFVLLAVAACITSNEPTVIPPVATSVVIDENAFAGAPALGSDLLSPRTGNPARGECSQPAISTPRVVWADESIFAWNDIQWPLSASMTSVAISESGAIYVSGTTCGVLDRTSNEVWFGELDAFVRKYEANGNLVWSRQFGTRGNDSAWSVAVGPDGSPVVSGFSGGTFSGLNSAGKDDIFIRKFDQDGNVIWTQQFGSPEGDRAFNSLAVGSDGSVYISGETDGAMKGSLSHGGEDGFVAKFSSSGAPEWVSQFGTSELDGASSVEVNATGQVYVGGSTDGQLGEYAQQGNGDSYLIAYDEKGTMLWTRQFGSMDYDTAMAIDTAPTGMVFVAGIRAFSGGADGYIHVFDPTGESVRSYEFGTDAFDFVFDIEVTKNGHVITVGHSRVNEDEQIMIARFEPGAETPTMQHFGTDTNDAALGLAVSTDGVIYVAGELNRPGASSRSTEKAAFVAKLNQ